MIKLILILTFISNLAFAQNAVYLGKGQPAPFDGDLLTLTETKLLHDDSLDKSSLQKQLDLANQNINLLQQDKTLLLDQNGKLIKSSQDSKTLNDLEKVGIFFLGILATAAAIKGVEALK